MNMNSSGSTSGVCFVFTLCLFLADGVFGDKVSVSVMEGDSVTLNTDVTKQPRDKMLWYFNNTLIAIINGEASKSCVFDGEGGRFRDRLEVDYETGSLTITNIRYEHIGAYEAEFIQSKSSGTSESLNRNSKCDRTKIIQKMSNIGDSIKTYRVSVSASLSVLDKNLDTLYEKEKKGKGEQENDKRFQISLVAGIVVAVVLVVFVAAVAVAGVILYRRRRSENADGEKNKLEHLLKV